MAQQFRTLLQVPLDAGRQGRTDGEGPLAAGVGVEHCADLAHGPVVLVPYIGRVRLHQHADTNARFRKQVQQQAFVGVLGRFNDLQHLSRSQAHPQFRRRAVRSVVVWKVLFTLLRPNQWTTGSCVSGLLFDGRVGEMKDTLPLFGKVLSPVNQDDIGVGRRLSGRFRITLRSECPNEESKPSTFMYQKIRSGGAHSHAPRSVLSVQRQHAALTRIFSWCATHTAL